MRTSRFSMLAGLAAAATLAVAPNPKILESVRDMVLRDKAAPKNEKDSRQRKRYLQRQARKRNRS